MKLICIIFLVAALMEIAFGSHHGHVRRRRAAEFEQNDDGPESKAFRKRKIYHDETGSCMGLDAVGNVQLVDCDDAPKFVVKGDYSLQVATGDFEGQCLTLNSFNLVLVADCDNTDVQWWYGEKVWNTKKLYRIRNKATGYVLDDIDTGMFKGYLRAIPFNTFDDQRWKIRGKFW